ncbi:CDP-diacylglycerol--serine O-phosphatidyltransferase [Methylosinus sp. R-45379]|jgi:CDP-diacylglycerol--serine O-phosphatidyltransferase|uniref:CDP-diacylglycerol--serine O-phosphatidyltransferase n=1 Tax=unclassified Methylosinus TaxID=2624500 RepID=UPI00068BCB5A|nr:MULTISPECIES: CDP-diacylglycerol--serine O-phosphatidyltransferase [unclassified Methylosinus]OAI29538.1 CDP-diacylglycerol--serine O-phosphatidyltransferase [Methylosinus sp. R-45379]TDX65935.1 CDP-diacylglycerol--serine O-phosphatidyltransferase [Methylosinus sp. sav-2]
MTEPSSFDAGPEGRDAQLSPSERRRLRFRNIPIRVVLPNLVTLLALAMGLTAIRYATEGKFDTAVTAVIAAAVLDGLDGRIARALKGTSRFGAELDSLADFVDFGVAPALLLYLWSLHEIKGLGWFAALVFAIACALRLARFNVTVDDPGRPAWHSDFFVGMPAPAGAVAVLLPLYLNLSVVDLPGSKALVPLFIVYVLGIAFLMASRIPHFSGKRIGRIPREYVILVLFCVGVTALLLAIYPMETLVLASLAYLVAIPFGVKRYKELERQEAEKTRGA